MSGFSRVQGLGIERYEVWGFRGLGLRVVGFGVLTLGL